MLGKKLSQGGDKTEGSEDQKLTKKDHVALFERFRDKFDPHLEEVTKAHKAVTQLTDTVEEFQNDFPGHSDLVTEIVAELKRMDDMIGIDMERADRVMDHVLVLNLYEVLEPSLTDYGIKYDGVVPYVETGRLNWPTTKDLQRGREHPAAFLKELFRRMVLHDKEFADRLRDMQSRRDARHTCADGEDLGTGEHVKRRRVHGHIAVKEAAKDIAAEELTAISL